MTDTNIIMVASVFFSRVPRILVSCELEIMTMNESVLRHFMEQESMLVSYKLVDITCFLVDLDNHSSRIFFEATY